MRVGIPKGVKEQEHRVAATPAGVAELACFGHEVLVQRSAGQVTCFPDTAYQAAGARIGPDVTSVYKADLIFKVKEPLPAELPLLRNGQVLSSYLYLAADSRLAQALLERGVTAIGFKTVEDGRGRTPLLAPMPQIAGRIAIQAGMQVLKMRNGGHGMLLSGAPGVPPREWW